MMTGMALHLNDIAELDRNLHIAAAGLLPETAAGSWESDSEVLKKYFQNFERMSLLLKGYADFLEEDKDRIYHAAVSLLEFDGRMIS